MLEQASEEELAALTYLSTETAFVLILVLIITISSIVVTALTQLLHQTIKYKLHKYQTITFISSKKLGYLFLRMQKKNRPE